MVAFRCKTGEKPDAYPLRYMEDFSPVLHRKDAIILPPQCLSYFCYALLVLFSLLTGCAPSHTTSIAQIGSCAPLPCFKVDVTPFNIEALRDTSTDAAQRIRGDVDGIILAPLEKDEGTSEPSDISSLLRDLHSQFEQHTALSENRGTEWTLTRKASLLYSSPSLVTVEVLNEGYLGGAHGFSEHTVRSYRKVDGSRITIDTLIAPYSHTIFESIAEIELRRALNIPIGESLYDAGFSIRSGMALPLPENFGITEKGLLLYYNAYEIAPYSKGPTSFVIATETLQPVLRQGVETEFFPVSAITPPVQPPEEISTPHS